MDLKNFKNLINDLEKYHEHTFTLGRKYGVKPCRPLFQAEISLLDLIRIAKDNQEPCEFWFHCRSLYLSIDTSNGRFCLYTNVD